MLKGLILGILLGILLVAGGIYYYFSSGHAPVATSAPPIPFEKRLVRVHCMLTWISWRTRHLR